MTKTAKEKALAHWEAADQFLLAARTDISRGHHIKATAIGLVALAEYIEYHRVALEGWNRK